MYCQVSYQSLLRANQCSFGQQVTESISDTLVAVLVKGGAHHLDLR